MTQEPTNTVKMFGCLHTIRKDRGLPVNADITLPPEGRTAEQIAHDLDLPLDKIEGVFVNNLVFNLDKVVLPGDQVAFVPTGVPGPHRYTLGIYSAGKQEQ
ncbi:MoaD/ThiS family protein [Geomonas sp. RF6]|uniref:MoaD/ThiS family protein n=1 Tax=Geomonas sp. RF6 TaxID=2897342 RepID=UPI001E634AB9|nr:MoaD/ThiS family protein [Geomonas sp. RF6]UFS70520.1 MoaD/ThiS family protein [Geomonas sp. RF6]